jgi:hypothetical protein
VKREDHTNLIRDIRLNLNDEAKVTDLLTQLSDDYGSVTADLESTKQTAESLKTQAESLREVNMRLFLKVGNPIPVKPEHDPQEDRLKFEDLFNEKGGLK